MVRGLLCVTVFSALLNVIFPSQITYLVNSSARCSVVLASTYILELEPEIKETEE